MQWRPIEFSDVPSRPEFEELTLDFLRQGVTNSDAIRDKIRRDKCLILQKVSSKWNESPSNKFVNEHAWVLEDLISRKIIEKTAEKTYRLSV